MNGAAQVRQISNAAGHSSAAGRQAWFRRARRRSACCSGASASVFFGRFILAAIASYFLILGFSSNTHDRSVEAAMTVHSSVLSAA
jgi:hypothetical protein